MITNRWIILLVLFVARTAMGFQLQSVASVSPLLVEDLAIDFARLGALIGVYMLPGVVVAAPGGCGGNGSATSGSSYSGSPLWC